MQTEDTLVTPGRAGRLPRPPISTRAVALVVAAAVIVAVVLYLTGVFNTSSPSGNGIVDNAYPVAITRIRRASLQQQTQVSATLTYAGSATVVVPSGTSPSALLQAQQQVTTAESQLATANATLDADSAALTTLEADLAAARAKRTIDCAGTNAAQAASSAAGATGGAGATGCAGDAQTVATDEQSLTQDTAKVASDHTQAASAASSLQEAQTALAAAAASQATFGQDATYTSLPPVGAILHRGQTLLSIGGQPMLLMYGSVAAWRAFEAGMTPGSDVAELNANLDALGYGRGLSGDAFTAATAAAIDALESAHGETPNGVLALGSVDFQPGAVRVTGVTPTPGAAVAPGPVLTLTLTTRQVQIALDAALQSDIRVGDAVTITLPDNSTTPGRVTYVGTVATTPSNSGGNGGSGNPTINVYVTPTDPAATGTLDQAPVNVSITTASVNNVLVVPVDALLALSSGGYALEEVGAGNVHHLVGVAVGLFDDASGNVQVSGAGLAAGQRIVVPNI